MPSKSSVRRQSAVFLVYVNQLPRWVPLVLLPALLIAGLALPGAFGAVALVLLAIVIWFLFMASPTRNASHRVIRFAVPLVILAIAVAKLVS
ncbi:DUF6703 family protein [Actinoallomurus iriomotensis]|uniref:Uncharacterized protein n=1 Tax=Actinoallomurus iriomotensis TaxID=478107 RepID=A0A9W6VYE8_9ACTN|nr:DUF6703 family protein [Actinoallomurus iriomotensis]GLY72332.1 hypothetical protein Airi01_005990 [Actinoallomurus iriomotensis]GLY89993.1 hypothetical protein Airi02_079220 [Actinoallomurus iriomotensis]